MRLGAKLLSLCLAAAVGAAVFELGVPRPRAHVVVDLAPGTGRWAIARQLAANGVIGDPYSFEAWAMAHPHRALQAGSYRFGGRQSEIAVFNEIGRGATATISVVVPEGYNRFDIARLLAAKDLGNEQDLLAATADPGLVRDLDPAAQSLEGFLFPATYRFPTDSSPTEIASAMVRRFRQVTATLPGWPPRWGPRSAAQTADIHQWLIIASLVEKETAQPAERPVIAGVFFNRLARNLPLQCDPTVIYAAELAGDYQGTIRKVDLDRPSPFNTYRANGLPPGPIANPGAAAITAAMHPAATNYLYFVSDDAGSHRFAVTLAEQKKNVQLYQRAKARDKLNR